MNDVTVVPTYEQHGPGTHMEEARTCAALDPL